MNTPVASVVFFLIASLLGAIGQSTGMYCMGK